MPHKLKISPMRKKLYLFPLLLLGFFMLATTSCLNSNDDNEVKIDEEWKALNETRFAQIASDKVKYSELKSQSDNGSVFWEKATAITDTDKGNSVRITVAGKPEFTDTVVVRYEGWYFNAAGEKVIFDSTENPSLRSKLDYTYGNITSPEPNYNKATFALNPATSSSSATNYVGGIIEGCSILLQDMVVGEERDVCIPQALGYGSTASTYSPSTSAPTLVLIPAYTTLWFRFKLYEIIPMKGLK